MKNRVTRFLLAVAAALPLAAAASAQDLAIDPFTCDGGGDVSTGGSYVLGGTIGQPDAGTLTGGTYQLDGGFWIAMAEPPCPEDLNGNGQVDFADILAVIGAWGPCSAPCPEDLNDNGQVDFADILAVIAAWGGCP